MNVAVSGFTVPDLFPATAEIFLALMALVVMLVACAT